MKNNSLTNVGILLFDDVEILDFCGPFEVFSVCSDLENKKLFNVATIGDRKRPIITKNGLSVNPDYDINEEMTLDILIIPGGDGSKRILENYNVLNWVHKMYQSSEITMTVCSGTRIAGAIGLLDNLTFTTHHEVFDDMKKIAPLSAIFFSMYSQKWYSLTV